MKSVSIINRVLFDTAEHLLHAGQTLSKVEEFREHAAVLFKMAESLANTIEIEPEKVTKERMDEILGEIMSFGVDDGNN